MRGLLFEDAPPPVSALPVRTDIGCFIGRVQPRSRFRDFLRFLPRVLRSQGWHPRTAPEDSEALPALPDTPPLTPSRFVEWLRAGPNGWTQTLPTDPGPGRRVGTPTAPSDLFEACLQTVLPRWLCRWLAQNDWFSPVSGRTVRELVELEDIPVPIDTWDTFDTLFSWDRRPLNPATGLFGDAPLGAAVRSFFSQGGRKAYVISLGPPTPPGTDDRMIASGLLGGTDPSPLDRRTWRGIGCLLALPDVSFLVTPDLPEAFRATPMPPPPPAAPETLELFVECTLAPHPDEGGGRSRAFRAPRCDEDGFRSWRRKVESIGRFLAREAREVQWIVALPLPIDDGDLPASFPNRARALHRASLAAWEEVANLQTVFVQIAFPWFRSESSTRLPEGLESPDGALAGLLAGNALARGTHRSALLRRVRHVHAVEPVLPRAFLEEPLPRMGGPLIPRPLVQRLSVFGPTPDGIRLLSDVTTAADDAWFPANVNRLMSALVRAARVAGEPLLFENSGTSLWAELTETLDTVLFGFWREGAFQGESPKDAYSVRCDRSTMSQADLDAGRLVVEVSFRPAATLDRILVQLALHEGGRLSVLGAETSRASTPAE